MTYSPKTGARCTCKRGAMRDNCPNCEGTGWAIDFRAIHAQRAADALKSAPIVMVRQDYSATCEHCGGRVDALSRMFHPGEGCADVMEHAAECGIRTDRGDDCTCGRDD